MRKSHCGLLLLLLKHTLCSFVASLICHFGLPFIVTLCKSALCCIVVQSVLSCVLVLQFVNTDSLSFANVNGLNRNAHCRPCQAH